MASLWLSISDISDIKMKNRKIITKGLLISILCGIFNIPITNAEITDGMSAYDLIGQYDNALSLDPQPVYTKYGRNDGENILGIDTRFAGESPHVLMDTVGHRFYLGDGNRILVYTLNVDNTFPDKIPDFVLGQPDFISGGIPSNQSRVDSLSGLALDSAGNRLFVAQAGLNRVTVFDVSTITNGENAVNVLGQADFDSFSSAATQAGLNQPSGLHYDSGTGRLFVADMFNNRVMIFDVATVADGENAVNVLGQTLFTTSASATTQAGMSAPKGVFYDSGSSRLFVVERSNSRVTIFDLTVTTDGENAANVIGQTLFTTSASGTTAARFSVPENVFFQTGTNRLFVSDSNNNRVMIFDLTAIADGENAVNVLGQTLFTTGTQNLSQSGFNWAGGLTYDSTNNDLYVGDRDNSRVLVFDIAAIANNENAVDVIGQYDGSLNPVYTKGGQNNGPNRLGMADPLGVDVDSVGNRLFVADSLNNRVLVYNLNADDTFIDHIPDFVLGQPDFFTGTRATTQAGLYAPTDVLYEEAGQRLFVAEEGSGRVVVYDVAAITNGENAVNVLGQVDFDSADCDTTQASLCYVWGLAYDETNERLFVSDRGNYRVKVYDISDGIVNNENAINVLGQPDFSTTDGGTTQNQFEEPWGLAYDEAGERLFVNDIYNSRVMVFDVAAITDGENAVNVLGQTDFTSFSFDTTQSKFDFPTDVSYDGANQRLFVADANNFRILTFDVASITNGENAVNVVGQEDFVSKVEDLGDANFYWPQAAYYNETSEILFVSDFGAGRVMAFNGEAAPADLTAPVIAEVTPVSTPDNDTTPDYTFSSDEAGDITYGGACSSIITAALVGNNTVTFDALAEGTYNDCTVMVTDAALNDSNVLNVSAFTIDLTAPTTSEVTPVPTPTTDTTPSYSFNSTEGGNISYGGGCTSATTTAVSGSNTITFNELAPGVYNCTITITDASTNVSNVLNVNSFTIQAPAPAPSGGGGGGAGGGFGKPSSSGEETGTGSNCTTTTCIANTPKPVTPDEEPNSTPETPTQPIDPTIPEQPTTEPQPEVPGTVIPPTEQPIPSQDQPVQNAPSSNESVSSDNSLLIPDQTVNGLSEEEIIFVTDENETDAGAGVYGREANRTQRQLSLTCNYANFSSEFGISITQSSDADGDGLSDQLECLAQTNPTEADTDGDGFTDAYEELTLGTDPRESNGEAGSDMLIITTPEEQMLTGDETPLVKGVNTAQGEVEIYIFDSKDFEDISARIIAEIETDGSLGEVQKAQIYDERFTQAVQNILSKHLSNTLNSELPEEAKFINRIQLLGTTPTAGNSIFLLDSEKSLVDNKYLAMAHNERELYSEEVEFEVDSSLKVLNPDVNTLGNKPVPIEALLGELKIEIDPGNLRPVLAGNIKEPSKVVANWQSDIVSSALIADSLDEDFRLAAPSDLEPGEHVVYVTAYRRSDGAQSETLKIPFTVSADRVVDFSGDGLPWWYIAGGVGAVVVIAGAVWLVRRKKS
jgi:DNA-binding beta-propeller fold protein YncE